MKKKVIFFDGDGTLWYPKATKRTKKPHWIYHDELTKNAYLEHLELTPGTKKVLEQFHRRDIYLVVISANPYAEDVAIAEIKERIDHFGLSDLFYAIRSSDGADPQAKAVIMLDIIKELSLEKDDAVMIGDSYFYDYLPAKEVGIDALFIENDVATMPDVLPKDLQGVREVADLEYLIE